MSYWSWGNNRTNGLKGVDGTIVALSDCTGQTLYVPDPTNPTVLNGETILYALRMSHAARADFVRLFPTLLPDEQARLTLLLEENPKLAALMVDTNTQNDTIQANWNRKLPVRWAGRGHGAGVGRNDRKPFPYPKGE